MRSLKAKAIDAAQSTTADPHLCAGFSISRHCLNASGFSPPFFNR